MNSLAVVGVVLITTGCVVFAFIWYVKRTIHYFLRIKNKSGINGCDACGMILRNNAINGIGVHISASKINADNYNHIEKTINLNSDIYTEASISSVAIAAHECGHAILFDKKELSHIISHALQLIVSIMFGVVSMTAFFLCLTQVFDTQYFNPELLAFFQDTKKIKMIVNMLFLAGFLFGVCCLPSEILATKVGLEQMLKLKILDADEIKHAKKVLYLAWGTYLISVPLFLAQAFAINKII